MNYSGCCGELEINILALTKKVWSKEFLAVKLGCATKRLRLQYHNLYYA
jgi:hypothetical protein